VCSKKALVASLFETPRKVARQTRLQWHLFSAKTLACSTPLISYSQQ